MARFIKAGQFTTLNDKQTGALSLPAGSFVERPVEPNIGAVRYNTDSGATEYYTGLVNGWQILARAGTVEIIKDSFTGDGSTAVYTMSVTPFSAETIFVFVGNVYQNPGVAYSISGADITFSSAPPDTHTIVILHGFDSTQAR